MAAAAAIDFQSLAAAYETALDKVQETPVWKTYHAAVEKLKMTYYDCLAPDAGPVSFGPGVYRGMFEDREALAAAEKKFTVWSRIKLSEIDHQPDLLENIGQFEKAFRDYRQDDASRFAHGAKKAFKTAVLFSFVLGKTPHDVLSRLSGLDRSAEKIFYWYDKNYLNSRF